jgi:hypothetical protein
MISRKRKGRQREPAGHLDSDRGRQLRSLLRLSRLIALIAAVEIGRNGSALCTQAKAALVVPVSGQA